MATLNLKRVGTGPYEEKKPHEFGLHANIRESKHRILSAVVADDISGFENASAMHRAG
jgi:hypothetical protein